MGIFFLKFLNKLTLLQAEIGWWTIGWPAKGNKGLGVLNERGRNLVPAQQPKKKKKNQIK